MLVSDGAAATQSLLLSAKPLRDSQWGRVRPAWFDVEGTAFGVAHPQSSLCSSIPISEITSSRKASALSLKIPHDGMSPQ